MSIPERSSELPSGIFPENQVPLWTAGAGSPGSPAQQRRWVFIRRHTQTRPTDACLRVLSQQTAASRRSDLSRRLKTTERSSGSLPFAPARVSLGLSGVLPGVFPDKIKRLSAGDATVAADASQEKWP